MKKTTLSEIKEVFREYNKRNNINYGTYTEVPEITAVIVYKQSNFEKNFSETERSYRVNNRDGKTFFYSMLGNSMWGDCLDRKDLRVRLDYYNRDIEYCYFEQERTTYEKLLWERKDNRGTETAI